MDDKQARREGLDPLDYGLIAVVFGLMGAFFWAIRGTGGYGGESGGTLAGLGWAMLWLGFSQFGGATRHRPYGHGFVVLAILYGIAFGGFTGYGVYIGWVQGKFYLDYPAGLRGVGAWTGYSMLFLCGLHWGGVPGAFMAWCAPSKPVRPVMWAGRIGAGIGGALFAAWFVRAFPQLFLPYYGEGIYDPDLENATCIRAEDSIRTIAPHVGLYLGFLAFELGRMDARAVKMMLTMGLGFAIPFTIGGYWQTFNDSGIAMPWWKFWEMSIGLGGGLAFGLAFYLLNRPETEEAPRPVNIWERRLAAAAVLLAVGSVVYNGFDGFRRLHSLDWSGGMRVGAGLIALAAAAAYGAVMLPRSKAVLPQTIVLAAAGVIIAAGYFVSIPGEWALSNYVLVPLYTGYIAVSAACLAALRHRR